MLRQLGTIDWTGFKKHLGMTTRMTENLHWFLLKATFSLEIVSNQALHQILNKPTFDIRVFYLVDCVTSLRAHHQCCVYFWEETHQRKQTLCSQMWPLAFLLLGVSFHLCVTWNLWGARAWFGRDHLLRLFLRVKCIVSVKLDFLNYILYVGKYAVCCARNNQPISA